MPKELKDYMLGIILIVLLAIVLLSTYLKSKAQKKFYKKRPMERNNYKVYVPFSESEDTEKLEVTDLDASSCSHIDKNFCIEKNIIVVHSKSVI